MLCTVDPVDREIFTLKIICVKNFCGVKFLRFRSIREIYLTVDGCNSRPVGRGGSRGFARTPLLAPKRFYMHA